MASRPGAQPANGDEKQCDKNPYFCSPNQLNPLPPSRSMKKILIVLALSVRVIPAFSQSGHREMIGADISFLPQLEARGENFYVNSKQEDAIRILKDHRFNYIRLRIFVDPAADSGYSPHKGFCDL